MKIRAKENYLRIFAIRIFITSFKGGNLDKIDPSKNRSKKFEGGGMKVTNTVNIFAICAIKNIRL